jgi:tetratricopeptide (TPR) repeat protein
LRGQQHHPLAVLDKLPTSFLRITLSLGLVLLAALGLSGCRTSGAALRYETQESFMQIIQGFAAHDDADLYRFPPPVDLSGQNVFKATLVRLANYQELYPESNRDVIDFCRAGCYERLGEYGEARIHYARAIAADSELEPRARTRMALLDEFLELKERRPQAQNLGELIDEQEAQATGWRQLATSPILLLKPYESLALIELEDAELLVAETIWNYRNAMDNGTQRAIQRLEAIIEDHAASRRVDDHIVRLGRWWEQLAREYVALYPPSRARFQQELFAHFIDQAREQYRRVVNAYGSPWRDEAVAALETLEEFNKRVMDEYGAAHSP